MFGEGERKSVFPPVSTTLTSPSIHHVLRMRLANHLGRTAHVIVVGLAVEKNPGIVPAEAQLLNTGAYLRRRAGEVRIDQDVPLGRDDEIAGEIPAADIIEIVRNLEGSNGGCP